MRASRVVPARLRCLIPSPHFLPQMLLISNPLLARLYISLPPHFFKPCGWPGICPPVFHLGCPQQGLHDLCALRTTGHNSFFLASLWLLQ